MDYRFTYLLMGLIFFVFWLILFIWRKNIRKEMIVMSLIFAIVGPISEMIYTQDWWRPITLTGTAISLESCIVGFMIGGIASVIYEDVFKKNIRIRKILKRKNNNLSLNIFLTILILGILFFGSFYILKLNSLYSTILTLLIPTVFIWFKRKDLIIDSLVTGFLLIVIAILVYSILEILTPGWIHAFWYFKNIPNIVILNLPIDDIIWYFFAGLLVGPLYEFWKEGKLIKGK